MVGGGRVGTRRALKFLDAGATVTVASLDFSSELLERSGEPRLRLVRIDVSSDHDVLRRLVEQSDLVVVATSSPDLNKHVFELAHEAGKLVNDATDAGRTDVIVPFEAEINGIRVAVTTEGRSGVVARLALSRIQEFLKRDVELATMLEAMCRAKKYMKEKIREPWRRIPLYFEIERDEVFRKHAVMGDVEAAWSRAKEIIDQHVEEN